MAPSGYYGAASIQASVVKRSHIPPWPRVFIKCSKRNVFAEAATPTIARNGSFWSECTFSYFNRPRRCDPIIFFVGGASPSLSRHFTKLVMGNIVVVTEAFAAGLSEYVGELSGLALDREQLLEHLPATNPLYAILQGEQRLLRVQSEVYANAVGHLLFALGVAEEPDMPTIGSRLNRLLGPDLIGGLSSILSRYFWLKRSPVISFKSGRAPATSIARQWKVLY